MHDLPSGTTATGGAGPSVTLVHACLRDGVGGSPTAVLEETGLGEVERRGIPAALGTSHAVFVSVESDAPAHPGAGPVVSLRFFTAAGELPACGHGTIAAMAFLAERSGQDEYHAALRSGGRVVAGRAVRTGGQFTSSFDWGPVGIGEPEPDAHRPVLDALGVPPELPAPGARVAELGRRRLLVPVATQHALQALTPDFGRLAEACDRLGLLGCYAYSPPSAAGRLAARMFAPSIGVPEDIANANSTACLAALLAGECGTGITVDMGDALGTPATITASARLTEAGPVALVGGTSAIERVVSLP
ncbi:PhzF family phenazine biosynthesis protein [Streptomyces sparsogenes]|uniref:Epimerase PhzC/PhzF n=1 Tax=Streptomyces sparsogenes DSM 40356 TaxID=1331668 RepID=A0A1R1SF79_9ACTN|nr:PhzF family phenazine biosynthesis protein [Streptomyces sparsogenes]OMI36940.1 epimerase PhzC/PhzF [Streptomyces sparsogenes DSM 40356]